MTLRRLQQSAILIVMLFCFTAATAVAAATQPTEGKKVWTKTECESVNRASGDPAHLWIPPTANPTAVEGNFCFMKQLPTNLQIHIGDTYVVDGVHNYINIVYKYGLGLGIIIMIITIMFSGIQWMVSGMVDKINDAKQRIMNASLGLLLLFGASTLLNTINPQLINLRTPPIHAVRPELFDLEKTGKRCDPGIADSCAKYGAKFKCKPTDYYAHSKCQQQLQGFMALTLGSAALAATGPFLIPTGGGAAVAEQGAGHVLKEVAAQQIKEEAVEQSIDAVTNKTSWIAKGVFAVTGVSLVSSLFGDAMEATDPAFGYCVEIKPEKSSFSVCQYDGECQSGKCLLTSSGACGAGKYGVCTSGAVREACLIQKSYSFGLIDALSNADAAKKYKCTQGSCVDNGRGATKSGVGICSDGSDIGLPCGDGVSCTNKLNALSCVNGFCREKNYFNDSGVLSDIDLGHPRCMLPTDCSDGIKGDFWQVQGTQIVGCLKNPNKDLNLPARLLVPQINKAADTSYVRELSSYGRCVTGNPFFVKTLSSGAAAKIAQSCFVNVYPDKSVKKVGCGKGACGIFSGLVTTVSAVTSIKGECATSESNDKTYTKSTAVGTLLYVNDSDTFYDGIKIPNIVDLQYSSAGAAQ